MQGKLLLERERRKLSKSDIARHLGITLQTYTAKEHGQACFTLDEMFALASYFEMSLDDLFLPRE